MKYPRTYHLSYSPGVSDNDKIATSINLAVEYIITEKMDGSNICLSEEGIHARSEGNPSHPSFDLLKQQFYTEVQQKLIHLQLNRNRKFLVYGEWLYAKHSIEYKNLKSYLQIFAIYDKTINVWLGFTEIKDICKELCLTTVSELGKVHLLNSKINKELWTKFTATVANGGEGIVLIPNQALDKHTYYKLVRENHVQTGEHWMNSKIVENKCDIL